MPYTPTNWAKGDIITAERLNKIEQGIQSVSSGGTDTLVANLSYNQTYGDWYYLDQTLGDIYAAVMAGKHIVVNFWNDDNTLYRSMPVTAVDQVDKLNNTSVTKTVYCRQDYYFCEKNPSNYPVIYYYWEE